MSDANKTKTTLIYLLSDARRNLVRVSDERAELRDLVINLVNQFAIESGENAMIGTGGMRDLEDAFRLLGLPDPCERKLLLQMRPLDLTDALANKARKEASCIRMEVNND